MACRQDVKRHITPKFRESHPKFMQHTGLGWVGFQPSLQSGAPNDSQVDEKTPLSLIWFMILVTILFMGLQANLCRISLVT